MNDLHSGRRAFLVGLGGAIISLPLLEHTHGRAFAQGPAPKRFLTVFEHGGTISNMYRGWPNGDGGWRADGRGEGHGLDYWAPASTSETLALGPIHQDLAPWASKLLVLQGVDNRAGILQSEYADGGHGTANVTALTAADISDPGDDAVSRGPSIDHVLAERLAAIQPARFSRIHLDVSGHHYGSPYFRAAGERVEGEPDPRAAFDSIFEGVTGDGAPDPALLRRIRRRRSVLDGALDQLARFRSRVSASDRAAVDAHLEHLRALERELDALETPPMCAPPDEIAEASRAEVIGPLHVRIIVAALRCGLTNVANLEIADIITPWVGGTDWGYEIGHSLHHYAREIGPEGPSAGQHDQWVSEMLANRRWRMSLVRQLIEGLDDPTFLEGDRTLLDNSLVLCTSEFSNGAVHVAYNVPVLLAGSAGGYFRTGRNIDYDTAPGALEYTSRESTHNLFTSILQAFGGDDAHFGSEHAVHQGPLPELT
ncbi:DUF1552 domain-containing protein [Sandaracinus amylolyticus]|uniref:DUF1552 domain-containing protein n=1 Tax=Sandaracinus amylolyticus TaxID=927083 RepID=UPI001F385278|nr:DUF1552 domain-containing protein [Sandaracinus amylolyticus]UJR79341.1 Hypothetical protein I5071_13770 [Sandaracinus amylolyticus]